MMAERIYYDESDRRREFDEYIAKLDAELAEARRQLAEIGRRNLPYVREAMEHPDVTPDDYLTMAVFAVNVEADLGEAES